MIISKEIIHKQIEDLLEIQSGLCIRSESDNQIELVGEILVNRQAKGFVLYDAYPVQIVIPLDSDSLPFVKDIGSRIAQDYPHRYKDGKLCLETDTYIRVRFLDEFSLVAWIQEFVEPYFFSYEFYKRYGEFPFGERGHGLQGVLETYEDLFCEKDPEIVFKLMMAISKDTYRGHVLCPCGSMRRVRVCHGPAIMKFYTDKRLKEIVQSDYSVFEGAFRSYYEQLRNQKKAK